MYQVLVIEEEGVVRLNKEVNSQAEVVSAVTSMFGEKENPLDKLEGTNFEKFEFLCTEKNIPLDSINHTTAVELLEGIPPQDSRWGGFLQLSLHIGEGIDVLESVNISPQINVRKCLELGLVTLGILRELGEESFSSPDDDTLDIIKEILGEDLLSECLLASEED